MKKILLVFLALPFLTGCSGSPSIQDQVLLIQYEKCLDFEREVWIAMSKDWSASMISNLEKSVKGADKTFLDYDLDKCAKFLP